MASDLPADREAKLVGPRAPGTALGSYIRAPARFRSVRPALSKGSARLRTADRRVFPSGRSRRHALVAPAISSCALKAAYGFRPPGKTLQREQTPTDPAPRRNKSANSVLFSHLLHSHLLCSQLYRAHFQVRQSVSTYNTTPLGDFSCKES